MKKTNLLLALFGIITGFNALADDIVEIKAEKYQVVEFKKGSSALTDASKKQLANLIAASRKNNAEIDKVHVAAWSDTALPIAGTEDLSKKDRELAEARAKNVEDYLEKSYKVDDVSKYNLAERANWLAKAFNTKDAELKSLFTTEKSAPLEHAEFMTIRQHGAPARAVVVIRTEKEVKKM